MALCSWDVEDVEDVEDLVLTSQAATSCIGDYGQIMDYLQMLVL